MKIVRFPEGCEVSLYIPLIEMTEGGQPIEMTEGGQPIDPTKLTDLVASVSLHGVVYQITPLVTESCLVMPLSADLKAGQYIISYSFKYDGRPCSGRWANALEIVKDNAQSNWQGYVATKYVLDDQIFIAGPTMTDEELEQLKEEYRAKIAEEDAVIEEYEEKIRSLDDMAKETTSQQIKKQTAGVAKKTDLPTDYARHGEYDAKLSELSTQCDGIDGKIGTPLDGQPSTLFAAIAASGGGGGGASVDEIVNGILAKINVPVSYDGITFVDGYTPQSVVELVNYKQYISSIVDDKIISNNVNRFMAEFTAMTSLTMSRVVSLAGNFGYGDALLERASFPNLVTISIYFMYQCTKLREVYIPKCSTIGALSFGGCVNLIDITIGENLTSNFNGLNIWNPTNVLADAQEKQQLLKNIREHIAANLNPNVTATFQFHANVKAAIMADPETMAAFPPSWTII